MRRTIFHALLSSGLLAFCVVVVGLAVSARMAPPQEAAVTGDPLIVQVSHGPASTCGKRATIVGKLAKTWGERQTGFGLEKSEMGVLELFTSSQGSWTVLVSTPNGTSCVLGTGKHWTDVEPPIPGTDS